MIVAVPKETLDGERRVALVPATLPTLTRAGIEIRVESGAGAAAGFPDAEYEAKGAKVFADRSELFASADIVLKVRVPDAGADGAGDPGPVRADQVVIGLLDPLGDPAFARTLAERGVTALSMELIPRITRAQSMDALSSQATVAGYKAVLMAADLVPRMFPMMMTAAGTITPAHVFVLGAGVAGLQAIATARRLGAVVHAYDIRPAVKEQCESLGATFVTLDAVADDAETKGGYAKAMSDEFYRRQREQLGKVVAESHVVISTAAVPGKRAPVLVTRDMVERMPPGSVVIDLAAERGGNCEATEPGQTVQVGGATVVGPLNVPSMVPYHASQMYAKNIATLLLHLVKDGAVQLNTDDEITRGTLVARGGEVVHPAVREALGLPAEAAQGSAS